MSLLSLSGAEAQHPESLSQWQVRWATQRSAQAQLALLSSRCLWLTDEVTDEPVPSASLVPPQAAPVKLETKAPH